MISKPLHFGFVATTCPDEIVSPIHEVGGACYFHYTLLFAALCAQPTQLYRCALEPERNGKGARSQSDRMYIAHTLSSAVGALLPLTSAALTATMGASDRGEAL